ncbi:MAG: CapA family protein [Myxococcota bacterium]|nr:CapA family protein [Myxococcota bacterium]
MRWPWLALCLTIASSPAAAQRPGPQLALGGDVLYDAPLDYQLRRRAREVGRAQALREIFVDLAPTLAQADLALVNLETPVSRRYRDREEGPDRGAAVFCAPDDFLDALVSAGVDAVTIANNHAYDQGTRGLANTVAACEAREVSTIGAGEDAAAAARARVVEVAGARIAIAAWTEGSNRRPQSHEASRPRIAFLRDGTIAESLRAARGDASLVIAVFHWIREDLTRPRPVMRRVAREAAEAGADLVVGHGTHVPGATETLTTSDGREVPVLYSLGNLLAAMEEPAGTLLSTEVGVRDAPLAMVRTEWAGERLRVREVEVKHHWIARPLGSAPWLEGGTLGATRPVSIEAELRRLASASCGQRCDLRAAALQRRVALIDAAMSPVDAPAPPPRLAALPSPPARSRSPRPRPARSRPARSRPRGSAPTRAPSPRTADSDPRLAPWLRGAELRVTFPEGGARESSVDARAIARLAALLREDRSLRAEVIAHAPDASLAALRARRVKGLIAIRGPSRSRFRHRGSAGPSRVVIRLHR